MLIFLIFGLIWRTYSENLEMKYSNGSVVGVSATYFHYKRKIHSIFKKNLLKSLDNKINYSGNIYFDGP